MLNIVAGGFYGDEGKGKVVGYLARKDKPYLVVRAGGGPQAGHTVEKGVVVTQIPSGFVELSSRLLIARGTVINPTILLNEIDKYSSYGVRERIGIDYGCTIIEDHHIELERELVERIGSVGTGTGPARADRILRRAKLAQDINSLKPYLTDVAAEVNTAVREKKDVLVEGVQGYGLSLLNHRFYPFVTSQDTTASQFAADVGVGPKVVDEVTVVFKAYVSRVGKGPLENEFSQEDIKLFGLEEKGSVSGRARRIAQFNWDLALESLIANTGTQVALTNVDRSHGNNHRVTDFRDLGDETILFIVKLDEFFREKAGSYYKGIPLISTGDRIEDMVDLRYKIGSLVG